MTGEELAKLYAEVVKVRPEAEVECYDDCGQTLRRWHHPRNDDEYGWWFATETEVSLGHYPRAGTDTEVRAMSNKQASALIVYHWISMMPEPFCLVHVSGRSGNERWAVYDGTTYWYAPTTIEALANYLKSTGTENEA